jgi:translocation and assembly module TamA
MAVGWIGLAIAPTAWADTQVEVDVDGVSGAMRDNVRAYLSLVELEGKGVVAELEDLIRGTEQRRPQATDRLIRRLYAKAPEEIRQALRPFGYYQPVVRGELKQVEGRWVARFRIEPGEPVIVSRLDLQVVGEGRSNPAIDKARASFPLHEGAVLEHARYDQGKETLLKVALAEGFLEARFTHSELRVDPPAHRAEALLVFDTGSRFYFGPITIEQDILDPAFVDRFVRAKPGEPFSTRRLLDLQSALAESEYFSRVEIQPQRQAAQDHRVPVTVVTTPRKPRRYAFGLGYSTDTGPRATAQVTFRRINRRGHRVVGNTQVSPILRGLSTQYRIPIANVRSDQFVITASAEHEQVDEGDTDRFVLGISHDTGWLGATRRLYARLSHENFSQGDDDDKVRFLIPGASLSRLKADNILFARRGYSFAGDIRGGTQTLFSDTSFVRGEASLHMVWPLGRRGRWLSRLKMGGMQVEDFPSLPPTERFFAGGDQSVRGYGYRSLGSTDSSRENIGGRYLLVGSMETDYLVFGNFGAAAFVDAGNASKNFPPDPQVGVGVGLRWRSPAGMAKLDFALPLQGDTGFRIHISFGSGL